MMKHEVNKSPCIMPTSSRELPPTLTRTHNAGVQESKMQCNALLQPCLCCGLVGRARPPDVPGVMSLSRAWRARVEMHDFGKEQALVKRGPRWDRDLDITTLQTASSMKWINLTNPIGIVWKALQLKNGRSLWHTFFSWTPKLRIARLHCRPCSAAPKH